MRVHGGDGKMPDILNTVGAGGANNKHDVAMVQAMLKIVKNAKNQAYLKGNYDGVYGNDTKQAITALVIITSVRLKLAQKDVTCRYIYN
jgi:hypothetical protein